MLQQSPKGIHLLLRGEEGQGADPRKDRGTAQGPRGDLPDREGPTQPFTAVVHELGDKGRRALDNFAVAPPPAAESPCRGLPLQG